ncbi:D-inositol-3-phosphate glycosyltransferase [uncultured archaeon]|nr:D-inositol-3-phosphate glycosyltransferase [uncultured archaeon]
MKLAFIYYDLSSFVRSDQEILSRHFQVESVRYRGFRDIPKIVTAIWKSDAVYSWFASGHSFLAVLSARLLGKKSVVVAGGYDVAYVPEISYGQYTLGWHKRMYADYVLNNADLILAVSEFTKSELMARSRPRKTEVVYNCIDTDLFKPKGEKEDLVMTVASGLKNVIELKGLDTFVKAAEYLPDVRFLVVGMTTEDKKELGQCISSDNVELGGRATQPELIGCYQRAKVYCQLSYRESFGVALAEAMACGCVPVVTDRGALPEVVGTAGYIVPYKDPISTANAIERALSSGKEHVARERIRSAFRKELREARIIGSLKAIVEASGK